MKKTLLLLAAFALGIAPASAHPDDVMRAGKRVGPIILNETKPREIREWFGEPDSRRIKRRGCVKNVHYLRYNGELRVFAGDFVAEVWVLDRTITSSEHGDITIHTPEGLRVGDTEAELKRRYPKVRSDTHKGHTHYFLEDDYDRVLAKVVDGVVVRLEARPFEWC